MFLSIIDCKQRTEIHSCPTCRQSVSQSAESGTPRTRSRDSCNRADSSPNNASFTQMPGGKCGQHNARSKFRLSVRPTRVVLRCWSGSSAFSMSGSRSGHQTAEMGAVTLLSGLGNPTLRLRHYATDSTVSARKRVLRIAICY